MTNTPALSEAISALRPCFIEFCLVRGDDKDMTNIAFLSSWLRATYGMGFGQKASNLKESGSDLIHLLYLYIYI